MNRRKKRLLLEQADAKMETFRLAASVNQPPEGWINMIRTSLGMTLQQLGNRIGKSASHIKALETNEKNQTITLQSLHELAKGLDLRLVYGFVSNDGSLEQLVARRAEELARKIVGRSAITMDLENQANSDKALQKAIKEKQQELVTEIPKHLWD